MAIGFPADGVYQFDGSLFRELKERYSAGDKKTLQEAWSRAVPFKAAYRRW